MSFINVPPRNKTTFLVIDGNNFYATYEQVFKPSLVKSPCVVISDVGGIVLARIKEAKRIGIPMGAATFQWKEYFRKYGVQSLVGNFPLYADMSRRVVDTIESYSS